MAASNRPEVPLRDNGDNARRWRGRSFICRFEKSFANGYHPPFSIPPFLATLPSFLLLSFFLYSLSGDGSRNANAPRHRTNVPEKFPGLSLIFHAAARCSDIDFLAIFVQPPPCGPYSKFRMKSDGKRSWTISVNCFSTGQTESRDSLPGRASIMLSATERIGRVSTINYLSQPDYPCPSLPSRFATDRLSGPAIPIIPRRGMVSRIRSISS